MHSKPMRMFMLCQRNVYEINDYCTLHFMLIECQTCCYYLFLLACAPVSRVGEARVPVSSRFRRTRV